VCFRGSNMGYVSVLHTDGTLPCNTHLNTTFDEAGYVKIGYPECCVGRAAHSVKRKNAVTFFERFITCRNT